MKTKKISSGLYFFNGFYISLSYGNSNNIWNIWKDEHCTIEVAIGFHTKKQAIETIKNNY